MRLLHIMRKFTELQTNLDIWNWVNSAPRLYKADIRVEANDND